VSETERFVAREEEIARIHHILCSGKRRSVVLHGLGGIGKTQLAVEYVKRYKDSYSAIFWFNIKDEISLKHSFIKVSKQIQREHPAAIPLAILDPKKSIDETVEAVKAWLSLSKNSRWLLVYDNYDNPQTSGNTDTTALDIREYFPEAYQGSIIVTTRSSQVKVGERIRLAKLKDESDSLQILSHASGRDASLDGQSSTLQSQTNS
jgi:ATP/maltotriose-dependent transcriptional regulator MalT